MCVKPIIIYNKSKSRYGGLEYIKVPCRNCPECAIQQSNDYLCRAISLWNSLPLYYYPYFCTLTFRNEDLPKTNVYKLEDNVYKVIAKNVPTFDHTLYKRFRKNFSEYIRDVFNEKVYILSTCEYGRKYGRPHYHCIIFVPYYSDWRLFKNDLERFWHYGFTKNIRLVNLDGNSYNRSIYNSLKYVTKYVCKFEQNLPFYLRSDLYVTDYPFYDIKPRVFTSNDFGSSLENILTIRNYRLNNVYLSIKGDKQSNGKIYSLPYYYRRRKFVHTDVIFRDVDKDYYLNQYIISKDNGIPVLPYLMKLFGRPKVFQKTISVRSDLYNEILFNDFQKSVDKQIFDYNNLIIKDKYFSNVISDRFSNINISDNFKQSLVDNYRQVKILPIGENHYSLSSSLSLPYINMVEKVYISSHLKVRDPIGKFIIFDKLNLRKNSANALPPWELIPPAGQIDILSHMYFNTTRCINYSSLHPDYMKLEYMQFYLRYKRYYQYRYKKLKEIVFYDNHLFSDYIE